MPARRASEAQGRKSSLLSFLARMPCAPSVESWASPSSVSAYEDSISSAWSRPLMEIQPEDELVARFRIFLYIYMSVNVYFVAIWSSRICLSSWLSCRYDELVFSLPFPSIHLSSSPSCQQSRVHLTGLGTRGQKISLDVWTKSHANKFDVRNDWTWLNRSASYYPLRSGHVRLKWSKNFARPDDEREGQRESNMIIESALIQSWKVSGQHLGSQVFSLSPLPSRLLARWYDENICVCCDGSRANIVHLSSRGRQKFEFSFPPVLFDHFSSIWISIRRTYRLGNLNLNSCSFEDQFWYLSQFWGLFKRKRNEANSMK